MEVDPDYEGGYQYDETTFSVWNLRRQADGTLHVGPFRGQGLPARGLVPRRGPGLYTRTLSHKYVCLADAYLYNLVGVQVLNTSLVNEVTHDNIVRLWMEVL